MRTIKALIFVTALLLTAGLHAQTFDATVLDAKTLKPIPFATVTTGEHQGLIANEEGVFSFDRQAIAHPMDSVYVSSMGYEKVGFVVVQQADTVIALAPRTFELSQVFLSNKNLDAEDIIERVKERLDDNYKIGLSKKKVFFRQSDRNRMEKVDFGFKKSTIPELNKELIDSIARMVPRNSWYYREVVGDFYGDYNQQKFYVDKAAKLYDKKLDVSMDGLAEDLERIFKENVKPNSYLKIKSGIFGTKMQLDSVAVAQGEEEGMVQVEVNDTDDDVIQNHIKDRINELFQELFFMEDTKLDFLDKSSRYRFTKKDFTVIDDQLVYVLDFEPKGKKDFRGTLYIHTENYAIVRADFDNVRPLRKFGLLGMKYRENLFRGKMLFMQDAGGGYSPRYLELETGTFFGLDRPLKVIEKNKFVKGRRKQNELSLELDIETTQYFKYEMVVFDSQQIGQADFDAAVENEKIKATYLSAYDPNFWEGYTIIEPNAAIQSFEAGGK